MTGANDRSSTRAAFASAGSAGRVTGSVAVVSPSAVV
ncbi:Uncharacterised protein [Mycobacteroides abscessus]|nr:Uncharacterised protein [Mycobacteroides abscessus]